MRELDGPQIAYLMGRFPCLSETFILREIMALKQRGLRLALFSILRPESGPMHEQAVAFTERVTYRPPLTSCALWRSQLYWFRRKPREYLQKVLWAAKHVTAGLRAWGSATRQVMMAAYLAREAVSRGIRHVHANYATRPGTIGLLAAQLGGLSYSLSVHAQDVFAEGAELLPEKIEAARFVTACSRAAKEALVERSGRPDLSGKIHVLYHGVRPADWDLPRHPSDPPVILSVGRLVRKKGFDTLIDACQILARRGTPFRCEIIGGGHLHRELNAQIRALGLQDRVALMGPAALPDVQKALSRATAFALASRVTKQGDRDGLPNVLLEAMAAGVPVVATRVGGITEAVTDGETGLLVPPEDAQALAEALSELLTRPELRDRLAAAGRQRVLQQFDVDVNVGPLAELFGEVLKRGSEVR